MQLPNAEDAIIEPRKVREYLLSATHPVGRYKAEFFAKLGFSREEWGSLVDVLRDHARTGEAAELAESPFGRKFQVVGEIAEQEVVSVWIILNGEDSPRLITAYPGGEP